MPDNTVLGAFLVTCFAGLATGIGSAIALFSKRTNTRMLSFSLGFSAGVMVYISMVELLPNAHESLVEGMGPAGHGVAVAFFFGGILLTGLIDGLVPEFENPHEYRKIEEMEGKKPNPSDRKLLRMGLFSAAALAVHNFPEGIATFVSYLTDPVAGISIAVAVAIHNIPEGISVSVPIYFSTGDRKKAFFYSALTGLFEPLGAAAAYLVLAPILNASVLGMVEAAVAGIMIYISFDELLPAAHERGEHHLAVWALISGMAVMAFSLLLLS